MSSIRSFSALATLSALAVFFPGQQAMAQSRGKVIAEAVETLAQYLVRTGTHSGRPAVTAIEKAFAENGPRMTQMANSMGGWKTMIKVVEEAGENGPKLTKLMVREGDKAIHIIQRPGSTAIFIKHGDDAIPALLNHKGIAEELINAGGKPAISALNSLSTRSGRLLSNLAREADAETASLAKNPQVLEVIRKYGDEGMRFIWDNKASLAVATVLTAFLADPERFMKGAAPLVEPIAGPVSKATGEVAKQVAAVFPWNLAVIAGTLLAGICVVPRAIARAFSPVARENC
jgi:hypothetical protein